MKVQLIKYVLSQRGEIRDPMDDSYKGCPYVRPPHHFISI